MRKYILFVFLFLFINKHVSAQTDSLKYKYTNQTIYRYGGVYLKGSERLTFQDLRGEFTMSELGLISYTKARQYRSTSTIMRYASLIASIAALGVAANSGNRKASYILFGGQVVFSLVSLKFSSMSGQSLDRALWQRNKDLLFPVR